jgi:hypothetical protein
VPASEQLLDDLAGAVLDGTAVDWEQAESSADADAPPSSQEPNQSRNEP